MPAQYTLSALTKGLDVIIEGDPQCLIKGVCTLQQSQVGCISFLGNSLYKSELPTVQAAAVVLSAQHAKLCLVNKVITPNPYYVYAKIAAFFIAERVMTPGIHSTVVIGEDCTIHPSASIGPYVVLGRGVTIQEHVVIGAHCVIEDGVVVGKGSRLAPRVFLAHRVQVGQRVCMASGVVIGADGFGFAEYNSVFYPVPQLGTVIIGNDVDIGANTTIDRGTIGDTIIASGVKLDNQIQIAHNVYIGENTVIAGCTGIAGTTTIGRQCMIGGSCAIAGHLRIVDRVCIAGGAAVYKSILVPGTYSAGILNLDTHWQWLRFNAKLHRCIRSDGCKERR